MNENDVLFQKVTQAYFMLLTNGVVQKSHPYMINKYCTCVLFSELVFIYFPECSSFETLQMK